MVTMTQLGSGNQRLQQDIAQNQSLSLEQGDDVVFDCSVRQLKTLTKQGGDLLLDFDSGEHLAIGRFFLAEKPNVESVLTFTDTLYTAEEIDSCFDDDAEPVIPVSVLLNKRFHAGSHVLKANGKVQGGKALNALENAPFVYQFTISDEFPDSAKVDVTLNGNSMPPWLKLKKLGDRQYLLSGTPAKEDAGDMNLQIHIEV